MIEIAWLAYISISTIEIAWLAYISISTIETAEDKISAHTASHSAHIDARAS
jgi:hypothetical protein